MKSTADRAVNSGTHCRHGHPLQLPLAGGLQARPGRRRKGSPLRDRARRQRHRARIVTVLPISHSPPRKSELAVELSGDPKRRLGLDDDRSWVILNESNRFKWPGPDIRRANPRDPSSFVFGQLPYVSFIRIREGFLKAFAEHRAVRVDRTK